MKWTSLSCALAIAWAAAGALAAEPEPALVPAGWDPALAGDAVMERLFTVTRDTVKGAHDAEMAIVDGHAYIVAEVNDTKAGESAGWPEIYCSLSIVNLANRELESIIDFARSEQHFENETLPVGACFVPRILQINPGTLRCYFASEQPGKREAQTWYRDFDLKTRQFAPTIHEVQLTTAAGTFPMQPRYFHADAAAQGFTKPAKDFGFYLFDSFKPFDGELYVAINNFAGKQNGLARMTNDYTAVEILGHYNEPQSEQLSESAVNRLPDGTWMAICRNDGGNYHFTTSQDGRSWTEGLELPHVPNGANSKPTFDRFGDLYYLGWQEATKIHGVNRSVFNLDVSRDGKSWERKYRFESTKSFQYPTFREYEGEVWVCVTQGDTSPSRKERIVFGKLEDVGAFESQAGLTRKPIPAPEIPPAVMKVGAPLFTDRTYSLSEVPEALKGRTFLRTTIDDYRATVQKGGTLYALTPPSSIKGAASQESQLRELGFERMDQEVFELFPGAINHVCVYQKQVKPGEKFHFRKVVLLVAGEGTQVVAAD